MTSGMFDAIRFTAVAKAFGDIKALTDFEFTAPSGSVTVLLGPNGAGKTTTVRLCTGAMKPDFGEIKVLGLNPTRDGAEVRSRTGVVPPKPAFYDNLTGWENLEFAAQIFEADTASARAAAKRFGIEDALDQEVGGYSTGMRTRLALARSVIHDPEVLLLDEPTAGLDPEASRAVLDLIQELAGKGRTIVMCTHLLHEAEGVADQLVLMDGGRVQAIGSPADLTQRYMADPIVIFDAEDRTSLELLESRDGVLRMSRNGHVEVALDDLRRLPDLVAVLVEAGVRITRVEPLNPTLEDLYFEMQRQHREEAST